jgi:hypothetical protein
MDPVLTPYALVANGKSQQPAEIFATFLMLLIAELAPCKCPPSYGCNRMKFGYSALGLLPVNIIFLS